MTARLRSLFEEIGKSLPTAEEEKVLQDILDSTLWKDVIENQLFVRVRNSLNLSIHLIAIEPDDNKKLDKYQYYRFGLTNWIKSDPVKILNNDQCSVLYKLNSKYTIFKTFTKTITPVEKIFEFLRFDNATMVEIGVNLLMKDPKSSKLRFMCPQINVSSKNSFDKSLFEIFNETDRNGLIEFFLQNECDFPCSTKARKIPQIKEKLKLHHTFHNFIQKDNFEAINDFLNKHRNLKYINNVNNESACKIAIRQKKYKVYGELFERGLTVRNDEASLLRDEGFLNYFCNAPTRHEKYFDKQLQILASTTFTVNKSEMDLNIDEIYDRLNEIPEIQPLLKVLFNIKPLFIIIDYKNKNITNICYYGNENMRGLFDPQMNRIFISGGGGTNQLLGTFAHEITHLAMNLLYENNSNPFYLDDENSKKCYEEIVKDIHQNVTDGHINEEIITLVFKYEKVSWHAELIVRVNHILAFYGHKNGTQILKEKAPKLLKFYNAKIVPDLEKYQRSHVNRYDNSFMPPFLKAIESNCLKYTMISTGLLRSVTKNSGHVVIETKCIELTCLKLFSNMIEKESQFNLNNTYMIDLKTMCADATLAFSYFRNYKLIIVAYDTFKEQCDSNVWNRFTNYVNGSGKRFIFVVGEKKTVPFQKVSGNFTDTFQWTDFDVKSQELIFNKFEMNFLGHKRKLNALIDFKENSPILNSMFSAEIIRNFIFCQSIPAVGAMPLSSPHYINRALKLTIINLANFLCDVDKKYICQNISNRSVKKDSTLTLSNSRSLTFAGKKLTETFEDSISHGLKKPSLTRNKTLESKKNCFENDIVVISFPDTATSIIRIGAEKIEIQVCDLSSSDLQTLHENNENFNIHWFMYRADGYCRLLKTFGSLLRFRNGMLFNGYGRISELYLFDELQYQKIILVAAIAGMGKTSTLKNIAKCLVERYSSIWAAVIILRNCAEMLEAYDSQNSEPDYILEVLIKLLQFKTTFEKELFKCCIKKEKNSVHIFFDGADEISPTHTKKIIQLIEHLSKTNIKHIMISVRLNLKTKFEDGLKTFAIEIQPLSYYEQKTYMRNIWKATDNKIDNVKKIVAKVFDHFDNMESLFNSPMQIYLIAEICKKKLPEFSKNLDKVKEYFDNELTLMGLYEKFIELKLKILYEEKLKCESKVPILSELIGPYMEKTIQKLRNAAIITLLSAEDVNLFLKDNDIKSHKDFIGKIQSFETYEGIVDGIVSEKLNFVHQTYADYLFADFLINQCDVRESKERECFFFERILTEDRFAVVRKFLNSFKGDLTKLICKPKHFQIPATPFEAISLNLHELNLNIFQHLITLGFNNTVTFIPKYDYLSMFYGSNNKYYLCILKILCLANCNLIIPVNNFYSIRMNFERKDQLSQTAWIKKLFECELQFVKPNTEPLDTSLLKSDLLEEIKFFTSKWNDAKAMEDRSVEDLIKVLLQFLRLVITANMVSNIRVNFPDDAVALQCLHTSFILNGDRSADKFITLVEN